MTTNEKDIELTQDIRLPEVDFRLVKLGRHAPLILRALKVGTTPYQQGLLEGLGEEEAKNADFSYRRNPEKYLDLLHNRPELAQAAGATALLPSLVRACRETKALLDAHPFLPFGDKDALPSLRYARDLLDFLRQLPDFSRVLEGVGDAGGKPPVVDMV